MLNNLLKFDGWPQVPMLVSDDGALTSPNLHDANLFGIMMLQDDECALFFRPEESLSHVAILLNGVNYIKVNNFLEGNIVLDISICSKEINDIHLWKEELRSLLQTDKYDGSEKMENMLNDYMGYIMDGKTAFMAIFPSYGCELYVLYKEITIYCEPRIQEEFPGHIWTPPQLQEEFCLPRKKMMQCPHSHYVPANFKKMI